MVFVKKYQLVINFDWHMLMPKINKQLYKRTMPTWLKDLDSLDYLPIADLLSESVYYPASNNHDDPIYAYAGFSHSFVYVDPHISREPRLQELKGYRIRYSRDVRKEELCFKPYHPMLPTANDGNLEMLRGMANLPERAGNNGQPFALWQIYERNIGCEWAGPLRISVLRITGEGIATYQALYFSNQVKPLLLFNLCCTCCTWSIFEERNGFFNRVVLANPAGHPDYMAGNDRVVGPIWNGYERRIETKAFYPTWIADDIPLGNHYLHKPFSNSKKPSLTTEYQALLEYAKMVNTLNSKKFEKLLADDVVFSTLPVQDISGKKDIMNYITNKLKSLANEQTEMFAEIGKVDEAGHTECVVLSQSTRDNLTDAIFLDMFNGKIKRIIMSKVSSLNSIERTGTYPMPRRFLNICG